MSEIYRTTGCSRRSSRPSRMCGQISSPALAKRASWSTLVGNRGTGARPIHRAGDAACHHAHNGFGESGGRLDPVQPGQRDQHVQAVARKAAARPVAGNLVRPLAVYFGSPGSPSRNSMRLPI